jgi:hypothetical protein
MPNRPYATSIEAIQAENFKKLPADIRAEIKSSAPYDRRNDRTF